MNTGRTRVRETTNSTPTRFRNVVRVLVAISGLLLLGMGVVLSYQDKLGGATATYGTAIVCLIFVFLSDFKRFKGLGIEAELLDQKIEEADELLARLRGITAPLAEMLFSLAARMGRWGTAIPRTQRHDFMTRIQRALAEAGVSPEELEQAKGDWHYFNAFDLCSPALQKISDAFHTKLKLRDREVSAVPQPIGGDMMTEFNRRVARRQIVHVEIEKLSEIRKQSGSLDLAARVRAIVSESPILDQKEKFELLNSIDEELRDIEHYVKHREFRRPAVWFSQDH